jgi:hypothetical protein
VSSSCCSYKHDTHIPRNPLHVLTRQCLLGVTLDGLCPSWCSLPCRERDAGAYGTPAYYTAVLLFDIVPMRVVPPLFFAMFSYWMIGLHTQCTSCVFAFIGNATLHLSAASNMCM